jgi:hypothetical protein
MSAHREHCLAVLSLLCCAAVPLGDTRDEPVPGSDQMREFTGNLKSPDRSKKVRQVLFGIASSDALGSMQCEREDKIAIYAGWEQLTRDARKSSDVNHNDAAVARAAAAGWFTGFVQGRLKVRPPTWWSAQVTRARFADDGAVCFPLRQEDVYSSEAPYRPIGATGVALRNVEITARGDGDLEAQVGDDKCSIPREVVKNARAAGFNAFSVSFTDDACYWAIHDTIPTRFQLIAIDRATSATRWTADCWASGDLVATEGPGYHYVQIVSTDDAVFVFGGGPDCAYIEVFARRDGAARLRFCTAY